MPKSKIIDIGEPPKKITIREPTVKVMRQWLLELEKLQKEPIDFITNGLFDDVSLTDIVLMTDLTLEDMETMVPSEIHEVVTACKEINPNFFTVRQRRMLTWQMESHTAYATLTKAQQWMISDPGPPETISNP